MLLIFKKNFDTESWNGIKNDFFLTIIRYTGKLNTNDL